MWIIQLFFPFFTLMWLFFSQWILHYTVPVIKQMSLMWGEIKGLHSILLPKKNSESLKLHLKWLYILKLTWLSIETLCTQIASPGTTPSEWRLYWVQQLFLDWTVDSRLTIQWVNWRVTERDIFSTGGEGQHKVKAEREKELWILWWIKRQRGSFKWAADHRLMKGWRVNNWIMNSAWADKISEGLRVFVCQ